jgi:molybdenum cofactor synthesis domain-containing protein
MLSVTEAIKIIKEQTTPLQTEHVALTRALGRILAEDITADTDLPPFNRAQMDGYAVRAADTKGAPVRLRLVGEAAAGRGWHEKLREGEAVRIMTGAPVPFGADSVQKIEVTRESEDCTTVEIKEATVPGQFIVGRASEVREGTTVLRAGETITAAMIATLASFGYAEVSVAARPRVSVLATGSELVRIDEEPGADQIRDSNTYTLGAYATLAGARVKLLPKATDDPHSLTSEIEAAACDCDALVLSGGVSMGVYDFTKAALRALGAEIFFERVRLRPGKPTVFARLNETLIFGLPGNPVSVAVTFNLFTRTALRQMQGARDTQLSEASAVLARAIKGSIERASYLPAELQTDERGQLLAAPLSWGGSSDFVGFARARALIIVPVGARHLAAGTVVRVVYLP